MLGQRCRQRVVLPGCAGDQSVEGPGAESADQRLDVGQAARREPGQDDECIADEGLPTPAISTPAISTPTIATPARVVPAIAIPAGAAPPRAPPVGATPIHDDEISRRPQTREHASECFVGDLLFEAPHGSLRMTTRRQHGAPPCRRKPVEEALPVNRAVHLEEVSPPVPGLVLHARGDLQPTTADLPVDERDDQTKAGRRRTDRTCQRRNPQSPRGSGDPENRHGVSVAATAPVRHFARSRLWTARNPAGGIPVDNPRNGQDLAPDAPCDHDSPRVRRRPGTPGGWVAAYSADVPDPASALTAIAEFPQVRAATDRAREACTTLRWHQALRRRIPEAAAESRIRGAWASAELDGARSSLDAVRDLMRGARDRSTAPDPAEQILHGAMAATAATETLGPLVRRAPRQALARLHLAAAAELVPPDQLGRPRTPGQQCREYAILGPAPDPVDATARLDALDILLLTPDLPALVVAAIAHAEIAHARPFTRGNGLVARALERTLVHASGLDPTGVVVPEAGHLREGTTAYQGALAAYGEGTRAGLIVWLEHCADSLVSGADEGRAIADAVLAGRLT